MSREAGARNLTINIKIRRFLLPPVSSALVVGRRAPIGTTAMSKALEEMMPGTFTYLRVEHPVVESLIVRIAHLRRVPQDQLVALVLRHVEGVMDETEMLHIDLDIELAVREELWL